MKEEKDLQGRLVAANYESGLQERSGEDAEFSLLAGSNKGVWDVVVKHGGGKSTFKDLNVWTYKDDSGRIQYTCQGDRMGRDASFMFFCR